MLLLLSLLTACSRSDEGAADAQSQTPDSVSDEPSAASEGEPGRAMRLTPQGVARSDGREERADDQATPAPTRTLDARDSALAAERLAAPPQYPVDEVIGPLRTSGLSQGEFAARASARTMLLVLIERGAVRMSDLLEPRPSVVFQLEELAAVGDEATVRVGRAERLPTGEVSVLFRVIGQSSWHGELILEMAEGRWYTSDVQAAETGSDGAAGFVPGIDNPAAW